MRLVFDPTATLAGWWDSALTGEGWFDEDFAPDLAVSSIAHVNSVDSKNPNNQTNTSLVVTLGSTTIGDVNFIDMSGSAAGTDINPTVTTPSGWTKIGEAIDSGSTNVSFIISFCRVFQSGDPSTVTINWANAGQMVATCSAYSGVDSSMYDDEVLEPKTTTDASYAVSTTFTAAGWARHGFGNRSGDTWSALTGTTRGTPLNTSASCHHVLDSNGDVSSGSVTRTGTGSASRSQGIEWIYRIVPVSGTNAPATEGTGTGTANNTTSGVRSNATESAGTGAAQAPTGGVKPNGAEGAGTGAAQDAALSVAAVAAQAAGTGAGQDATGGVKPNSAEATGTGSAYDATIQTTSGTTAAAAEATGTGAAHSGTYAVALNSAESTATGSAYDPTVTIANSTTAYAQEADGVGTSLQPVAGADGIVPGATTTGKTANNQTNTSMLVTLPTANPHDTIVIDILIFNSGIDTDPGFTVPAGWTQIGYALDTTGGVGVAPYGTSIYRHVEAGDPTTLNLTWSVAGQGGYVSTAYTYVDAVTPIDAQQIEGKGSTNTSYSVPLTTSDTALIRSWFGNRSGHTYSALGDTTRGSALNTSATSLIAQDTNGMVSPGSYTKTATGSGTTIAGIEAAYALLYGLPVTNVTATPSAATGTGDANVAAVLDDRVGGGSSGNNSSPSVTLSSQIKPGQVVLVHIALNNSDVITSAPAVLTQIDSVAVGTANAADHIYYLLADGSTAGSTLSWTLSATRNWTVAYLALSNIDQQSEAIINAVDSVGDNVAATTSFTIPTEPTSADSYVVEVFTAKGDGVAITNLGFPAGYTPRAEIINPSGAFNMASGIADRTANPSSPGTYGGDTWTTNAPAVTTIRHLVAFRVADSAQAAPGEGEAPDAYPTIVVNAGAAEGAGSAPFDPNGVTTSTTLIGDNPIYAVGTAFDPIVQTGQFTTPTPVEGAGVGSAFNALVRISAGAAPATGTGDPLVGEFSIIAGQTGVAAGVGTAPDGVAATSQIIVVGDNIGTGAAYDATISTANQAIAPPPDANAFGAAYNATVFTLTTNDVAVAAGVAQGFGFAYTVFGYDVGILLRIKQDSLPGLLTERYFLSKRKGYNATGIIHTELALFISNDGTVSVVEVDAPVTDGEFIRNPSALTVSPGSFEADALIAAGYELEPVT